MQTQIISFSLKKQLKTNYIVGRESLMSIFAATIIPNNSYGRDFTFNLFSKHNYMKNTYLSFISIKKNVNN